MGSIVSGIGCPVMVGATAATTRSASSDSAVAVAVRPTTTVTLAASTRPRSGSRVQVMDAAGRANSPVTSRIAITITNQEAGRAAMPAS